MISIFTITIGISIPKTSAFQQIAGPVIVKINPGETRSFSWGLQAGNNETSLLKIYADGNGSEFLAIPQSFRLIPGKVNYIAGNVTIPINHPTNTTLNPIVHSTISENDTANAGGGNAVNVELSKMLTITVGANKTQPISNLTLAPIKNPALIGIGLLSKGTVNSVIKTPTTQWIASGNWSLEVKDGNVSLFKTNMSWNNINGTNSHTHEFVNLRVSKPILLNQSEKNISIKGLMDVGTNQRIVWKDVPATININGKKTISILADNNMTNHHFASQPILGVVNSFLICSDIPGPNMEVLPPCSEPNSISGSTSPLNVKPSISMQPAQPAPTVIPSLQPSTPTSEPQFNQESQIQGSATPHLQDDNISANHIISPTESVGTCKNISIMSANASGFETEPKDYNPPGEAIDSDMKTWWANKGVPSWLRIDLERPTALCTVEIAWNKGNERTYDFVITTSDDGNIFTDVFKGTSSGNSESYENYDIANSPSNVKSVKLDFTGSSSKSGWVSIKEISVIGR